MFSRNSIHTKMNMDPKKGQRMMGLKQKKKILHKSYEIMVSRTKRYTIVGERMSKKREYTTKEEKEPKKEQRNIEDTDKCLFKRSKTEE